MLTDVKTKLLQKAKYDMRLCIHTLRMFMLIDTPGTSKTPNGVHQFYCDFLNWTLLFT